MITFSIVTITYNAADVFKPTADSVMMQSYPHVEHIIVDGASKDNTVRLAEEYRKASDDDDNGHEIVIISEPDKGLYDAMNKGIGVATGDYICFMNAGDRFPSDDTLEIMAREAELESDGLKPAVLFGDTDIVDGNGNFLFHRRLSPPENLTWKSFRNGMLVCHQAFYARTDIAKRIPYDMRFRYSADVDWCIKVMKEAEKEQLLIKNVHAVIAHYMQEGQTTVHHRASLMERFRVMCRHYGILQTIVMHAWFVIRMVVKH